MILLAKLKLNMACALILKLAACFNSIVQCVPDDYEQVSRGIPFGFVSMWKQLYYYWDFLAEGIRAPKQGRLLAAVKPYSLYKYICVGYYRHDTLTSFGAKRFSLLISVYPIPADLLKKVNSLECSAELVKIKITRNNMRKISRYLPTEMKLKVKSVLKAAGLDETIGGN